jgi:hypothetical protein
MAKRRNQNRNVRNRSSNTTVNHKFKDIWAIDASATNLVTDWTTNSNGQISQSRTLSPLGAVTTVSLTGSTSNVTLPALPWFLAQARNYEEYRVTNAVLEFVPRLGTNVVGQIIITSSRDVADGLMAVNNLSLSGNTQPVPLGRSTKVRVPLEVDTNWKPVSNTLTRTFNNTLVNFHSLQELSFTTVAIIVNGPASSNVGTIYLDMSVQFRGPRVGGGNF